MPPPTSVPHDIVNVTRKFAIAALTFAAFVVYGSLVPLDFHYRPLTEAWGVFRHTPYLQLGIGSRADWVANILLYLPLGFFGMGWLTAIDRSHVAAKGAFVLIVCMLIAVGIEFTQLFFPPRTVSLNDIIAESIGSVLGIAIWLHAGSRLSALWDKVQRGGRDGTHALIALYVIAYLALSLFPFDFLVSATEIAEKLGNPDRIALFVTASCGGIFSCSGKLLSEVLIAAPLGVFLGIVARGASLYSLRRAFGWGILLGAVIEGLQTFLASGTGQGASILTRGVGMALGLVVYQIFRREWLFRFRSEIKIVVLFVLPLYLVLLLAINGFFTSALENHWAASAKLQETHFLPFYYHYFTTETHAVYSLLINLGVYAPIGFVIWIYGDDQAGRNKLWLAALVAATAAFGIETMKLFLVDRKPDPTNILIAGAAAALTYFAATRLTQWTGIDPIRPTLLPSESPTRRAPPDKRGTRISLGLAVGFLVGAIALVGWVIALQPKEHFVDESKLPQLPAPTELPEVSLPGFRYDHPRLPSPSAAELAILRAQNPGYLRDLRSQANAGKGALQAAVMQELIEPGSVDLKLLFRRLMDLKFEWRGHEQGKPIALAYDWLYPQWSDSQRILLRARLADTCDYLIAVIRTERLSPYNVILYNSPFQALMACSLALYGDDPRGDAIMRFTDDLWKNRVLPVWRQVMGQYGGWHEGGEYVGIGIGQAIFQVPNMWRHATGEDLFASEPGIRGFLDFLIYRTQPDGMHFHWGDGSFFDRIVPDALALALEYHRGYGLRPVPKEPRPTSWPWGPLSKASDYDPVAITRLPLVRQFDGIGMVVARTDWSPDATYVTFKAGDNYWSHSHLDQGAFTIYKGGELAIDSGLYGPAYGSDHHMNYSYQTIAHNVVTVTDPDDTVRAPGKDTSRPIANDGGQRRIGSGWGIEAAPLDRAEWDAKRDIYHTATTERLFDQDGLIVAVTDVTPAYTNVRSGEGTFSHRTRRVERFWRTFGYDRVDDVVIVFDQVTATNAAFRKRWLLHTLEEPTVTPEGFVVSVSPQNRPGHLGGRLNATVLLPKGAQINPIGGDGLEFFVDNKNYDENGTLQKTIKQLGRNRSEPGAWRIEVSPPQDAIDDVFLVVLLPSTLTARPQHRVSLLESGTRVGCEIVGPTRTTRWWFEPGRNGAEIEILVGEESRRHVVMGQAAPMRAEQGWLDRVRKWIGSEPRATP